MNSLPRWINHAYAELLGYWWLPCPVCGRHYGGHERTDASIPTDELDKFQSVCSPDCALRWYQRAYEKLQHENKSHRGRLRKAATSGEPSGEPSKPR